MPLAVVRPAGEHVPARSVPLPVTRPSAAPGAVPAAVLALQRSAGNQSATLGLVPATSPANQTAPAPPFSTNGRAGAAVHSQPAVQRAVVHSQPAASTVQRDAANPAPPRHTPPAKDWTAGDVGNWALGFGAGLTGGILATLTGAGLLLALGKLLTRYGIALAGVPAVLTLLVGGVVVNAWRHHSPKVHWGTALLAGMADLVGGADFYESCTGERLDGHAMTPYERGQAAGTAFAQVLTFTTLYVVVAKAAAAALTASALEVEGTAVGRWLGRLAPLAQELADTLAPPRKVDRLPSDARMSPEAAKALKEQGATPKSVGNSIGGFVAEIRAAGDETGRVDVAKLSPEAQEAIRQWIEDVTAAVRAALPDEAVLVPTELRVRNDFFGTPQLHIDSEMMSGMGNDPYYLIAMLTADGQGTIHYPGVRHADLPISGMSPFTADRLPPGTERVQMATGETGIISAEGRGTKVASVHSSPVPATPDEERTLFLLFIGRVRWWSPWIGSRPGRDANLP